MGIKITPTDIETTGKVYTSVPAFDDSYSVDDTHSVDDSTTFDDTTDELDDLLGYLLGYSPVPTMTPTKFYIDKRGNIVCPGHQSQDDGLPQNTEVDPNYEVPDDTTEFTDSSTFEDFLENALGVDVIPLNVDKVRVLNDLKLYAYVREV